jgi:hypothetical protein
VPALQKLSPPTTHDHARQGDRRIRPTLCSTQRRDRGARRPARVRESPGAAHPEPSPAAPPADFTSALRSRHLPRLV